VNSDGDAWESKLAVRSGNLLIAGKRLLLTNLQPETWIQARDNLGSMVGRLPLQDPMFLLGDACVFGPAMR
jgi:hypothetical protein